MISNFAWTSHSFIINCNTINTITLFLFFFNLLFIIDHKLLILELFFRIKFLLYVFLATFLTLSSTFT